MVDVPPRRPRRNPRLRSVHDAELRLQHRVVHGYRRAYRVAGEGPTLVLIHGIGDSSATWADLDPDLARSHTVIAPRPARPRLLRQAARRLLRGRVRQRGPRSAHHARHRVRHPGRALPRRRCRHAVRLPVPGADRTADPGQRRAASAARSTPYCGPSRCRAPTSCSPPCGCPACGSQVGIFLRLMRLLDTDLGQDAPELLNLVDALPDATSRSAFIRTLRAVVDWRGQAVACCCCCCCCCCW